MRLPLIALLAFGCNCAPSTVPPDTTTPTHGFTIEVPSEDPFRWAIVVGEGQDAKETKLDRQQQKFEVSKTGWSCTHSDAKRVTGDLTVYLETMALVCRAGDMVIGTEASCSRSKEGFDLDSASLLLASKEVPTGVKMRLVCYEAGSEDTVVPIGEDPLPDLIET